MSGFGVMPFGTGPMGLGTPVSAEPPPVGGYQGRAYVQIDDKSHCRFEFVSRKDGIYTQHWLKGKGKEVGPDKKHGRNAANRYRQYREELKKDGGDFAGMGR